MDILARHGVTFAGSGTRPLLLVHGFGTDQTMWPGITNALAPAFRVVLFDHIGSGRSDLGAYAPERYSTLDGYAHDVVCLAEALDLRDAVIVGHSVGGMIGLRAAIRAPDRFTRLVMIGSSSRYLDDPPDYVGGFTRADVDGFLDMMERNYLGWAKALAPQVMKSPDRPDLDDELLRLFCASDHAIARRFADVTFSSDSRALLPSARLPSLIIQAPDDIIVPFVAAEYMQRSLPSSTLRLVRSPGHFPHLRDPDETAHVIRDFLDDV